MRPQDRTAKWLTAWKAVASRTTATVDLEFVTTLLRNESIVQIRASLRYRKLAHSSDLCGAGSAAQLRRCQAEHRAETGGEMTVAREPGIHGGRGQGMTGAPDRLPAFGQGGRVIAVGDGGHDPPS